VRLRPKWPTSSEKHRGGGGQVIRVVLWPPVSPRALPCATLARVAATLRSHPAVHRVFVCVFVCRPFWQFRKLQRTSIVAEGLPLVRIHHLPPFTIRLGPAGPLAHGRPAARFEWADEFRPRLSPSRIAPSAGRSPAPKQRRDAISILGDGARSHRVADKKTTLANLRALHRSVAN
jgi:hypothetical protein